MLSRQITLKALLPCLLLIGVLVIGPLLASCGPSAPTATPTPTRTPRPTDAPTATPTAGSAETPAGVASGLPSATAEASPSPTPTAAQATATAPATPSPVARTGDPMASPDYGIQAFLWWRPEVADRDLGLIRDGGFTWVKQLFSWQDIEGAGKHQYDWTQADRVVDQVEASGLKLIVRLSQDPDRPFWAGAPPQNADHFADFAAAVAGRYAGRIDAYQIWNEPNLAREWGGKRPDPAGYARLLKTAYGAIKRVDPGALIITSGMAPTGTDSEAALPDIAFYEQIYRAMGGDSRGYFDMLGAHAAGFAAAPEISPDETAAKKAPYGGERFFAFRHLEDVRAVMERYGDQGKRIAVLEFGWTNDNRPESPYYWHGAGAGITEEVKGDYLVRALKYAREHYRPWIALMTVIYMPDTAWTRDTEQYYWSVIGPGYPELYSRASYVLLCVYLNGLKGASCPYAPPS